MSNLSNLLNSYSLWSNAPKGLYTHAEQIFNQTNRYFSTPSHTLNGVLRNTVGNYTNQEYAYKVLLGMCHLVNGAKNIHFTARYRTISSEEAETLTINNIRDDIMHSFRNSPENDFKFHIYLVPRGKTYLKNLLEGVGDVDTSVRLKPIETFAIEDASHFIRIYKNFMDLGNNTFTIFTDRISDHIIHTLIVMFPNIFDIKPVEVLEPEVEAMTLYNKRVEYLRNVFETLYKVYTSELAYDDPDVRTTILANINAFSASFQWEEAALKEFTNRLANVRNESKLRQINNNIQSVRNNIRNYEESLERYYNNLALYNRELNAFQALKPDDVSTLIETIKNTKAIELINATNSRLVLRVTAPLQYFTPSDFEAYERNMNSTFHQVYDRYPIIKQILHKIFVTREYKLILQAVINIDINTNSENILRIYVNQQDDTDYNTLPNPHLFYYNCWDKARSEINKFIANNEFDLALLQMVAAVQSVNVAEGASFINRLLMAFQERRWYSIIKILDENNNLCNWEEINKHEVEAQKNQNTEIDTTVKKEYTQIVISEDDNEEDEEGEE